MDAGIESVWPLFALRIRTERLVLRLPTERDLLALIALARAGIHPAGEMPFGVAWSTPCPARSSNRASWTITGPCGRIGRLARGG